MSTWNSVTTIATGYAGGQPVQLVSSSTTGLHLTAITSTSSSTGVIYSSDSGTTWTPSTGTPTTGLITAIVSDSTGQYVVFTHAADSFSTNTGGVYRSTDYGASFSQISILGSYAFDYVSCSADGQVIYANQPLSNQLMLSTNGGSNWVVATTAMSGNLNGCCSADGSYYYYGFGNSLIAGTGTGTTWSAVTIPTSMGQVACDATGLILVITCNGSGVYRSTNGGSTWTLTNAPTNAGQTYQPIACDPTGNIIVAGDIVNQTAYFSFDSGSTWNVIGSPFRSLLVTGDGQTMFSSNGYELYSTSTSFAPVTPTITSVTATDSSSVTIVFTLGSNGNSLLTDIQYATDHDSYASWTSLGLSTPLEGYTSASITGLSFNPIGANFQLRAVNAIGPSTASSPVLVDVVPDAPTITSVTANDTSSVTFTFTLGSNQGSDLTDIQYATSNDSYASWTSLGLTTPLEGYTTATISGLAFDPIGVYFKLRTVNVAGNSGVSNIMIASAPSIPSAPTITAFTPIDSASVYIAFTLGSNGYSTLTDIQYAISTDSYASWTTVGLSTPLEGYTNVTISGLAFDPTGVIFKLRAVNAVGPSNASNIVTVPDAPTITTRPLQVDTQQYTIGFTLGSNGGSNLTDIRYVMLDESLNNLTGDTYSIGLTPPLEGYTTATITIPDGLNPAAIANFQLFAVNANGSSVYSAVSHVATAPDYPTLVSAYVTNPTTAVLTFTLGSNGGRPLTDLQYAIYDNNYNLIHAFTSLGLTAPFEGYTTATITDLPAISYGGLLFNITAITAIGQGDSINNSFTPTTIVFPDAPTITSVTAIDTSSATIVFTLGSNQGSDLTDIQYATSNDSYASWTSLGLSTPLEGYTTATISGLAFDPIGVYFELRTINIAGNSPASNDVICVSSVPPSAWTVMYPYNFGCISSSTDGTTLAVGTLGSNLFYRSIDSGLSFQPSATAPPIHSNRSIGMSSNGATMIISGNDGYMYISTDSGTTFSITGDGFNANVSNVVCDSAAVHVYAAGYYGSSIYVSADGAATWTTGTNSVNCYWSGITCDSTGQYVYAVGSDGAGTSYFQYSYDFGANWTTSSSFPSNILADLFLTSVACDSTGQFVLIGTGGIDGIYRSTNYGADVSSINAPGSKYITHIACDSTGSKILAGDGSANVVFYSEDTGETWAQQNTPNTYGNGIVTVAMNPDATYQYASFGNGYSYINAYPSSFVPWSRVDPLYYYVHYSADNQYVVGVNDNNGQVVRSIDGGATWNEATTYPDTYPNRLAMDYSGQYVVGAWGNIGLFRSTDYADNFTQLSSAPSYNYECIATSYTGQYIYSAVWDGVIVLSSDSGATFTEVDAAGGARYWNSIYCSASGQYVYALCWTSGWNTELYYSSNYGQTWTMTASFSSYAIQDIACDATGQYVLATCGNDGVYRSTDYGATWTRTGAFYESPNGPDYRDIACNASGEQILVLDDNIGLVYRSTDSGATWAAQYMPGYYYWDGGSVAMSLDGSKQLTELYDVGTFTTTSRTDNIPTPSNPVPCFLEGTKILCLVNGKDEYVPVETLRKGSIVKTSLNGYKAVKLIGHRAMTNAGGINRDKNSLYLCTKAAYPELTEDLTITGCHAILVDQLTTVQRAGIINTLERIFVTDRKYRLPACIDERAAVVQTAGEFTVWHFALEHHDIKMNYGVYAQGLLVESSPIWHMSLKNYTLVQ